MFYGSLGEAAIYHAQYGNPAWSDSQFTNEQREVALRRGSRALDGIFGSRLTGIKTDAAQRLAWPRNDVYDSCLGAELPAGAMPVAVMEAAYELALVELLSPGSLSPSLNMGRLTKSESLEGVGSRSFFSPSELGFTDPLAAHRPILLQVEDLMRCFLKSSGDRWIATVV